MCNIDGFRIWLDNTTSYTNATKSNIVSRLKRADKIRPFVNEPVYLFYIAQESDFQALSVSVRSQVRKAIILYREYLQSKGLYENEKQ